MSVAGGVGGDVADERSAGARRRPDAHVARVGADVGDDVRKALAYILRSTQARPQSVAELRTKLRRREVDEATAEAALAEAQRLKAVDDAALARALVEEQGLERGHGRARVRKELERRQLPQDAIDDALTLLEGRDEEAAALELAERRLAQLPPGLEPEAVARRLAGYVARRGYPPALAQRVALRVSDLDRQWD